MTHHTLPWMEKQMDEFSEEYQRNWRAIYAHTVERTGNLEVEANAADWVKTLAAALTRILKWAREHTYSNWSEAGDAEAYANGPAEELIDALADAGFEIDHDDSLVIHGERVRE